MLSLARKRLASVVLQRDPLPSSARTLVKSVKHGGKGKKNPDFKRRDPPSPRPGDGSKSSEGPRKNLLDIVAYCPDWGAGLKFQKKTWRRDRYYVVSRIKLNKSLNHGKAWGVFHENGAVKTGEKRINGVNKRKWRLMERPSPESIPWKRLIHAEPERKARIMKKREKCKEKKAAKKADGGAETKDPEVAA